MIKYFIKQKPLLNWGGQYQVSLYSDVLRFTPPSGLRALSGADPLRCAAASQGVEGLISVCEMIWNPWKEVVAGRQNITKCVCSAVLVNRFWDPLEMESVT